MRNLSRGVLLVLFFIIGVSACIVKPEYPDRPSISFKSIQNFPTPKGQSDSVLITVHFQDGDGDLGLGQADSVPPFQALNTNGTPNKYRNNYFITVFKKNEGGDFEPLVFSNQTFTLDSRFPMLNTLDKKTALEGDLRFTSSLFKTSFSPIKDGDELRFEVQIVDRALNESNVIQTKPIILGQYE